MNRGPRPGSGRRPGSASFAEKLQARYGTADIPDWLAALATLCDRERLKGAKDRLNYSTTTISQVLSGTYEGDLARVEDVVRGALLGSVVLCPVLGEIGRDRCLDEQKQPYRPTSAMRAQLFRACKTCEHRKGGEHAE